MHILLANDDGIYAPGIKVLYDAIRDLGDVSVVAPIAEQSAVGHAITLSDPLKTKKINRDGAFFGYGVGGTPADCVKLAVSSLLDRPPDIVLSGINLGPNPGINIIYSGTVSAATEGTILGIPSMAVSINTFTEPLWETAAPIARHLAVELFERGMPKETLLNVNIPNLPADQIKGYRVTTMARSRWIETFDKRTDPRGNDYYWMDGDMLLLDEKGETDIKALREDYVSLTPIGLDLTRHDALDGLREWGL